MPRMGGSGRPSAGLVMVLLLATSGCWEPSKNPTFKNATGLEDYERLFWKAVQNKDWKEVEAHLAPLYTLSSPDGLRNREQAVEYFKSFEIREISIGDFESRPNGADFVVSYKANIRGNIGGRSLGAVPLNIITVWQAGKRGYVSIAHAEIPQSVSQP